MTPAALKALKESIAHWERLVKTRPASEALDIPYAQDCALCNLYLYGRDSNCAGCPVLENSGGIFCQGTPYYEAEKAWVYAIEHAAEPTRLRKEKLQLNRWRKAARAELRFLESLLPKAEKV